MVEFVSVDRESGAVGRDSKFDAVVAVGPADGFERLPEVHAALRAAAEVDEKLADGLTLLPAEKVAGGRLVFAAPGRLDRDFDDVRRFADAAASAVQRARDAGARRPFLVLGGVPEEREFSQALECSLLAAAAALWQPLEAREALGEDTVEPVEQIGFAPSGDAEQQVRWLNAVEAGRRLARDLGGTEPERMAPPRFAELCELAFLGRPSVQVEVLSDASVLREEYPLMMAVGRASMAVKRHRPRVIRLEYVGEGPIERTLLLAGKGVVYDTGGADLKVGGAMAGMSRDKCGGAAVAGFLKTLAELEPRNLRVIAEIGAVRNSIGSDAFVSDEIVTGHSGARVRIGNTDAEGRLVLADLLSHLRDRAAGAVEPTLFSVATLTGHAALAVGPYTAVVENGPARDRNVGDTLSRVGDVWGDCLDVSRSRREDFAFIRPRTKADDVLSCNNAPSSRTARGHQFPMAFLCVASGLDRHGRNSEHPLAYAHLDVAGSGVVADDWQHGAPTGAPIVALTATYVE